MEPFDTTKYNIQRKEDNTLIRVDGLGGETPEMTVEYYTSQVTYHEQVIANLEAQKLKVEEFLVANPALTPEDGEKPLSL